MADEDMEEMRNLRAQFQRGHVGRAGASRGNRDAGSDDDEDAGPAPSRFIEPPPRSSHSERSAFDSVAPSSSKTKEKEEKSEDGDDMARIMGFSGFSSGGRKSRSFDIEALVNDARQNARSSRANDSDSDDDNTPVARQKPPPASVKKGPSTSDLGEDVEEDFGPSPPPNIPSTSSAEQPNFAEDLLDEDSDFSDSEDVKDDTSGDWKIPCSYDLLFEHGDKAVTALAVDPVGARFATGSVDYEVKLWDFGGMQASLNPFRTSKPCESHAINNLSFSNGGEHVLVISGSAQALVIDRDGFKVMECPKGFQFIMDMTETKGHIAMLNSGHFSPKVKGEFCTCSHDGTVRVWSLDNKEKHKSCIKLKAANGRRTHPTTCAYSKDGKWLAAGARDGSIQMWDTNRSSYVCPAKTIRNAHANESDITSVCFSYDNKMICSRGMDDCLRLWDLNMLKKPVFEAKNLDVLSTQTDCLFSPNDKLIVTGTAVKKGEGKSRLVFYDRSTWELVKDLPVSDSSVIRTAWHPKLNQIMATTAEGGMKIFFDPNLSHNGALLCRTSKKRRAKMADAVTSDYIITPYALPMFKEEKQRSKHAQFERNRKDPVKTHRPDLPMNGPGAQGRVGQAGGTLSSYLVRKLGYATKMPDQDLNPREALLRHAEKAKNDPYWIAPAYAQTQPKPIFLRPEEEASLMGPASKKFKQ